MVSVRNAGQFCTAVRAALTPLADADRAGGMRAYMRNQFEYLGIPTPARRAATRALIRAPDGHPLAAARALWKESEREFQYVACDLLAHHAHHLNADALDDVLQLVSCKSWWDTVDALAHTVGALVRTHPALYSRMDELIDADDLWLRRTALIFQVGARQLTDQARLFDYCLRRAHEPEFFIRKAIGWALRDHARSQPQAVRNFLAQHASKLSALSVREAAKHLG